ncbi:hypothetical protein CSA37_01290 [Candidatus Fermentibacteria bacterium]|nr:MAG: hypothetical protein CSA37_09075 [Candidatus Fermentibacteria bacterium]PIE53254.1 MAG: hypothetical protein CSA37_02620 [Candidatus Fermentibacteria bacterium]PIE53483.1 MAG: hypothetical protein CSA37_01290 [Candidatus Fermentibacteria bacterium]
MLSTHGCDLYILRLNLFSGGWELKITLRLAELPITGSWSLCMENAVKASAIKPLPDVLLLPELFTIGFVLDSIASSAIEREELPYLPLAEAARNSKIWIAGGSFPVRVSGGIANLVPVYNSSGELVHTTCKGHLFRNMGEHTAFIPGNPSGVFDLKGIRTGAAVCYDLRFPELFRKLTIKGAELLLLPAQWPQVRNGVFRSLLVARSSEAQVFTAGCNLGGEHLGVSYNGGGGVVSPSGQFLDYDEAASGVRDFLIDTDLVQRERERINCLNDRRPEVYE